MNDVNDAISTLDLNGSNERSNDSGTTISLSRPVIVGNRRLWDITKEFRQNAEALPTGQLVKDESFTLFESVGALEIMDPKMDSGCPKPGETLEHDYDVLKELLPEEVIGIMDQMLCHEMAWHCGHPLATTLFTSLHLDRLLGPEAQSLEEVQFYRGDKPPSHNPLLHTILRAYCLGTILTCNNVVKRIDSQHFYEEEDFSPHTYHRDMLERFPDAAEYVRTILEKAKMWLHNDTDPVSKSISDPVKSGLKARLDLRRRLVDATDLNFQYQFSEVAWRTIVPSKIIRKKDKRGKAAPKEDPERPSPDFDTISKTNDHKEAKKTNPTVQEAFSEKIQRRLASTTPPRPMVELKFEEAMSVLRALWKDCEEAARIRACSSVSNLKAILWAFGSRKPEPLAYARAYMISLLLGNPDNDGQHIEQDSFDVLLINDVEDTVCPADPLFDEVNWTAEMPRNPSVVPDKQYIMASLLNEFRLVMREQGGGFAEMFVALAQNRTRMRRMLCHSMTFFECVTEEVKALDIKLRQFHRSRVDHAFESNLKWHATGPLSAWLYHEKLRMMEWIIGLGFEHNIYLPDEVAGIYMWLAQISGIRATFLGLLRKSLQSQTSSNPEAAERIHKTKTLQGTMFFEARGVSVLAHSLSTLWVHLHYLQCVPTPEQPYNDPSLRYELRMKPFLSVIDPEVIPYASMSELLRPNGEYGQAWTDPDFYANLAVWQDRNDQAGASFAQLRRLGAAAAQSQGVEDAWLENIKSLEKIPKAIADAFDVICKCRKDGKQVKMKPVGPTKRQHPWWHVPKVTV